MVEFDEAPGAGTGSEPVLCPVALQTQASWTSSRSSQAALDHFGGLTMRVRYGSVLVPRMPSAGEIPALDVFPATDGENFREYGPLLNP